MPRHDFTTWLRNCTLHQFINSRTLVLFHSQEKEIMKEIMDNGPVQGMG